MSDIFAEVDEVMKQERLEKIWAQYGNLILTFIIGTIVLTGAVSGYRSWDNSVKEKQTEVLSTVLAAENFPDNVDVTALELTGDVRAVALMTAGSQALNGETPDAARAAVFYKAVADDASISAEFRGLASLMVARLSGEEVGDAVPLYEAIYNNEKSLWRYHAALDLAALYAHEKGDLVKAREYLAVIIGAPAQTVPPSLVRRAESLDHVYAVRQSQSAK